MAILVGQTTQCFILLFKKQELDTVFPLISVASQISAAPLGIFVKISAHPPINAALQQLLLELLLVAKRKWMWN